MWLDTGSEIPTEHGRTRKSQANLGPVGGRRLCNPTRRQKPPEILARSAGTPRKRQLSGYSWNRQALSVAYVGIVYHTRKSVSADQGQKMVSFPNRPWKFGGSVGGLVLVGPCRVYCRQQGSAQDPEQRHFPMGAG